MTTWLPIATAPTDTFVLVACPSGYTTTPWVYVTARLSPSYRAFWIDEANDSLNVSGHTPQFWQPLPEQPQEADAAPRKLYVRLAWKALPNFTGHRLELVYANGPGVCCTSPLFRGWATDEVCIEDLYDVQPSAAPVPQVNPNIKEC